MMKQDESESEVERLRRELDATKAAGELVRATLAEELCERTCQVIDLTYSLHTMKAALERAELKIKLLGG